MSDLLLLSDLSQLRCVLRRMPQRLADTVVVTGSMVVAAELEKLGLPFAEELSYLTPDEVAENLRIAGEIAEQWWDDSLGDTSFLGISLARMARQEMAMPFELCLNARLAYRRMLESQSFQNIYGFFLPPIGISRTNTLPSFRPALSVAQAVLFWLAQDAGIPVTGLKTKHRLQAEGRQWKPHLSADDIRSRLHASPGESSGKTDAPSQRIAVLWKMGLWGQETAELERGFRESPGWQVVKLSSRELGLIEGSGHRRRLAELDRRLQEAWRACETRQSRYAGPYPEIFANRYLDFQFRRIFAEMREAARLGMLFAGLVDVLQPDLMVLGHDAFTIERTLVQIAKQRGVPAVGLVHGGLQPMFGRLGIVGDVDEVMVWGQEDVSELTRSGVERHRLHPVGSLRFDQLYLGKSTRAKQTNPTSEREAARRKLRLPSGCPVVLLLTAPTNSGIAQPVAEPQRHRQTWSELIGLAKRRPELSFAIKPHPAIDFIDLYRYLCRRGPRNLILLDPVGLDKALEASDAAVLVNYCSTAALEAMLANVPVVFLRTAIYGTPMHQDPLEEHGAVNVASVGELERTIDRLLGDGQFRRETLADARIKLKLLLGDRQQSALECMMTKFGEISRAKPRGCPGAPSDVPSEVDSQLAGVVSLLWQQESQTRFAERLKELFSLMDKMPEENGDLWERMLLCLAFAMGYVATDPSTLRSFVISCCDELNGRSTVPPALKRKMILRTCLSSTMRCVDRHNWRAARWLTVFALTQSPREAIAFPLFREFCAKSMIGYNRVALEIVDIIGRLRWSLGRLSRPCYLEKISTGE